MIEGKTSEIWDVMAAVRTVDRTQKPIPVGTRKLFEIEHQEIIKNAEEFLLEEKPLTQETRTILRLAGVRTK